MRLFRNNIIRALLLNVVGGIVVLWLAPYMPNPIGSATQWRNLFLQPIPAFVLFLYSIALVWAFSILTRRSQSQDRVRASEDKAILEGQLQTLSDERDALRKQLEVSRSSSSLPLNLMRFVAVVLSSPSGSEPKSHKYVCEHVAGLAGPGVRHDAVGEALALMLQIGAVRSNYRELELVSDWQVRLRNFSEGEARA